MKKGIIALVAAVLVLGSTPVYAAPSATGDDVENIVVSEVKDNVKGATSEAGKVTVAEVKDTKAVEAVEAAVVELLQAEKEEVKAKVLGMADVSLDKEVAKGTKITLKVDGIFSTDTVDTINALHWNGTEWENIKVASVARGEVTIEVDSLSPIAIVKVIPEAGKFGVALTVLPLVAAAGLTGAVVCGKKVKFNK